MLFSPCPIYIYMVLLLSSQIKCSLRKGAAHGVRPACLGCIRSPPGLAPRCNLDEDRCPQGVPEVSLCSASPIVACEQEERGACGSCREPFGPGAMPLGSVAGLRQRWHPRLLAEHHWPADTRTPAGPKKKVPGEVV